MQNPPLIRVGGMLTKALYQYSLQDTDTKELFHWTPMLMDKIAEQPGFQDVTSDLHIANPQVNVEIDRDKAAALGVTPQQIENALYDAFGERQSSTIYGDVAEYWVVFEVLPQFQLDPAALAQLYITSANTATNSTADTGSVERRRQTVARPRPDHHLPCRPVAVRHRFPSTSRPAFRSARRWSRMQKIEADMHLPATITGSFQGSAAGVPIVVGGLGLLLVVSILVIYIILGILYESFIHPLTILSGLPSAGFGALLTLMIFRLDLNIYGFVGLIMLVGIVKKNAIMMIDFAIEAQHHGKKPADAIYEGCLLRFRPIMMTTMCALMATLPIALGLGAGGESRRVARPRGRRRPGRLAMPDALHHAGDLSLHGNRSSSGSPRKRAKRAALQDRHQSGGGLIFKLAGEKSVFHLCLSVAKISARNGIRSRHRSGNPRPA